MKPQLRKWLRALLFIAGAAGLSALAASPPQAEVRSDTVRLLAACDSLRYRTLTHDDFVAVAEDLGVDVPTIRAVAYVEAGKACAGFNPDNTPIINFDLTMFQRFAAKRGINLSKYRKKYPVVFSPPNIKRYGSYQSAQYARLEAAMEINKQIALESTFWGMFQIGGFNYKLCGCKSVEEFVSLMSFSCGEQLELFAQLIKAVKYDGYLRRREWAKFAAAYNGPNYRKRSYDVRLANAYRKFAAE